VAESGQWLRQPNLRHTTHYFNVLRAKGRPDKTQTPLIVDAHAVLIASVTLEFFRPVTRRCRPIAQFDRAVQLFQLATRLLAACQ